MTRRWVRRNTLRRYYEAAGAKLPRDRRGPGAARLRVLRENGRPVRPRSGAIPGGYADIARRAATATATTASCRTAPPGRSDTVGRRAAPASATGPAPAASGRAATGAATAEDDRRDAYATNPATREGAHVGNRTQFICFLISEAQDEGAIDRPWGVFVAVTLAIDRLAALSFVRQFASALCLKVLLYRLRDIGWSFRELGRKLFGLSSCRDRAVTSRDRFSPGRIQ